MVTLLEALDGTGPLIAADGGARAAHRGQNSLSALEAAIDIGADLVVLDVRRCRDGAFVVFRDAGLARMTAATGILAARSSPFVTRLQLRGGSGGADMRLTQDYVPLLAEALAASRDRVPLILRPARWCDAAAVAAQVAAADMAGQVALSLPVLTVLDAGRALVLRQDHGVSVVATVTSGRSGRGIDAEVLRSFAPLMVHLRADTGGHARQQCARLSAAGLRLSVAVATPIMPPVVSPITPHVGEMLATPEDSAAGWSALVDLGAEVLMTPAPERLLRWRDRKAA